MEAVMGISPEGWAAPRVARTRYQEEIPFPQSPKFAEGAESIDFSCTDA
jgi:hypothetical protein